MGNGSDRAKEPDKTVKPVVVETGEDHSHDSPAADQAHLSNVAWFGDGTNGQPPVGQDAARPVKTGADAGDVTVTPVQTVIDVARGPQEGQPAAPKTEQDIEKLRQAIVEADKNAPREVKALLQERGTTLDMAGNFVAGDKQGQPDDAAMQAIEALKNQEIKQATEYNEYLAPGTTRADLGTALIAKGDDASVREGEQRLVEAFQARPDLIFHPNFRAQVMDAYAKMAQFRKDNGLEPWKSDIDVQNKKVASEEPWVDKAGDHFQAANDLYWNKGVKAAMPEFQKAIDAADETAKHDQGRLANEALDLFVKGLTTDRAIAQGKVMGETTTQLEANRVETWDKQVDNYVEGAAGARARMNVGLALIASGDPEMLAKGKQQLIEATEKSPGLAFGVGLANYSNDFTEKLFGAFKANAEKTKTAGTTDSGTPNVLEPAAKEDLEAGYSKNDLVRSPLPESNTDKKVEKYGWDRATDIGLPIATFGLMLATGRWQYNRYKQARAEREASFEITPPERPGSITRQATGGEERFEIKGRAKDGQVVAKNLADNAQTSASERPPVSPPKEFNPAKNKYGEYQPVKVDNKKYFLNKEGDAFELRRGKLYPTDAVRGFKEQEVSAQTNRPSPVGQERMGNFRDLLQGLSGLDRGQYMSEAVKKAQSALAPELGRRERLNFLQTDVKVSESDGLKAGESQLVVRKGAEVIKPTGFETGANPVFVTADGTKIPVKDTTVEIKIGKGSSREQAAREALVRTHELADIVAGKASGKPAGEAQADLQSLRNAFDRDGSAGSSDNAGRHVRDKVVALGAFEFQSNRVSVELTPSGVKFGEKGEVPYEKLVKDTTRDKRAELDKLEKEKLTSTDKELEGRIQVLKQQVADLEQLGREVNKPESVAKLMEAIQKQATPEEVARLRSEQGRLGGKVKETMVRGSAYVLVAAFVASALAGSSSASETIVPQYAPTSAN